MSKINRAPAHDDRYMGMADTAFYLGLSVRTLRKHLPDIPHFRVGRKLLFKKSECDRYMEQQRESEHLDLKELSDQIVEAVLGPKTSKGER